MRIVTIDNASATQTEHPTRAMVRTFFQTLIPALPLLVLAVPPVIDVILDETTRHGVTLPGWAYTALAGTAVACALIAAIVARVMAIPTVEAALRKLGLGAAPTDPDFGHWDGASDEATFDDLAPVVVEDSNGPDAGEPPTEGLRDTTDLSDLEPDLTPPPPGYEPRH